EDTLDISEITNPADRAAWVRERTSGRGADVVIEASGNPAAVPEGLEMLRDAGRYVVVGQYTDAGDATLNPHRQINRRHATILGCWGYEYSHLQRSIAMMAKHAARFRWRELVTKEYPLAKAGEALADMEKLAVVKALIRPYAINSQAPSRAHPARAWGRTRSLLRSGGAAWGRFTGRATPDFTGTSR